MTAPRSSHDDSLSSMLSAPTSTPSWVSPRRPFTMADTPSSPASSTASQKFEVKRLLSRPADPASLSPRPMTTFGTSNLSSENVPIVPLASLKRSNSFGKSLLKRRPSRTQVDDDPATPRQRAAPLAVLMPSYALPDAVIPNATPASAYARAYAQRTNMTATHSRSRRPSEPESSRARPRRPSQPHPFEGSTGRVVAVGDPTDDSLALTGLALAGFGPVKKPVETEGFRSGLTRKVSARFRRRKNSNAGVMSDVEGEVISPKGKEPEKDNGQEAWSREKERAVLRGMGLRPGGSRAADTSDATIRLGRMNRRLSRHLSIEDFRGLVKVEKEMGGSFEMWSPNQAGKHRDSAKSPERGRERDKDEERAARKRAESTSRRTRHDPAIVREREREEKRLATAVASKMGSTDPPPKDSSNTSSRTDSSPITSRSEELPARKDSCLVSRDDKRATTTRSNSTPSPEQAMNPESNKGGKIWRLVKKMSTGTLKEKKHYPTEKAPPVPALPNSRRSSVLDYGNEVRPELTRFGTSRSSIGRNTYYEPGSAAVSIHSGPSSLSGHATVSQPQPQPQPQPPAQRHRTASSSRPSLTSEWRPSMTNDSSAASTSPKSSFGRTQSPRTSMSSYVDLGDEVVPPLPLGKHIVSPGELAQQYSPAPRERVSEPASVAASPSLPPPKRPRTAQKPRDKPLASPSIDTPTKARSVSDAPVKTKSKPNVLRRPTRLASDGLEVPSPGRSPRSPRSPRSASMTMPSPRPRAPPTLEEPLPTPRPRSNSLGTMFTFREMEGKSKLTEQEKVAKFEQLLEASDKAGGTLHARVQDRLLSDSMRLSGNFDASSVSGL